MLCFGLDVKNTAQFTAVIVIVTESCVSLKWSHINDELVKAYNLGLCRSVRLTQPSASALCLETAGCVTDWGVCGLS